MRALSVALSLVSGAALALAVLATPAETADPSGKAVAVVQSTDILSAGAQRGLVPQAPVFMGDRIITDVGGEAQIQFVDNTRLVVGPGSSLLIDKFVFKGATASSVTINAVRGTFRFITGNSPKNAYLIRTPTATLGLRGTSLDVSIAASGETRVALYGETNKVGIKLCDRRQRNCTNMSGPCDLVVVKPSGTLVRPEAGERSNILDTKFPYLRSQLSLWSPFKVDTSRCGVSAGGPASSGFNSAPPSPSTPAHGPVCGPGEGGYGGFKGSFGSNFSHSGGYGL